MKCGVNLILITIHSHLQKKKPTFKVGFLTLSSIHAVILISYRLVYHSLLNERIFRSYC